MRPGFDNQIFPSADRAEQLDMIRPSNRAALTHLQYVLDHVEYSKAGVTPDIVEKTECTNVQDGFSRQFTQEEVKSWCRRGLA